MRSSCSCSCSCPLSGHLTSHTCVQGSLPEYRGSGFLSNAAYEQPIVQDPGSHKLTTNAVNARMAHLPNRLLILAPLLLLRSPLRPFRLASAEALGKPWQS